MNADAPSGAAQLPGVAESFVAPLLAELLEPLIAGQRRVVLDLGAARATNVAFFGQFRCRLGIADVGRFVLDLNTIEEPADRTAWLDGELPPEHFGGADVILAWDLFNYLEPQALADFAAHLERLARVPTALHALVGYSAPTMPGRPPDYLIEEGAVLTPDVPPADAARRTPRYSTGELQRAMPGWTVERSVLLRSGVQEYYFAC